MSMEKHPASLVAPGGQVLSPQEVVDNATTQAKILMDIVEKTKCYQEIRDKKYLQVEAWETIGAFNGVHAETSGVRPITMQKIVGKDPETKAVQTINGIVGYEAHVKLMRDGQVVGGAMMPCYFTENACKGKQGDEKHKAAMSAAQTFATSKAYRMNFSFIAILAGYEPVPFEELGQSDKGGNGGKLDPTVIDLAWLKDSLEALKWADAGKWLKEKFGVKGQTLKERVEHLTMEQQEAFVTEVQRRLDEKQQAVED